MVPVKPVTPCYTKLDWCVNKALMYVSDMISKKLNHRASPTFVDGNIVLMPILKFRHIIS